MHRGTGIDALVYEVALLHLVMIWNCKVMMWNCEGNTILLYHAQAYHHHISHLCTASHRSCPAQYPPVASCVQTSTHVSPSCYSTHRHCTPAASEKHKQVRMYPTMKPQKKKRSQDTSQFTYGSCMGRVSGPINTTTCTFTTEPDQ